MEFLRKIGKFLLEFYDRLFFGVLLILLAITVLLLSLDLSTTAEALEKLNQRDRGMNRGAVTAFDKTVYNAAPDLQLDRLWGARYLPKAWPQREVPRPLKTGPAWNALVTHLVRSAEGSIFDPMVYAYTRELDENLVHFRTCTHPWKETPQCLDVAPETKSEVRREEVLTLVDSARGLCLTVRWTLTGKPVTGAYPGSICCKGPEGAAARLDDVSLLATYQGDQLTRLAWGQSGEPNQGRVTPADRYGLAFFKFPTAAAPLRIEDRNLNPAAPACECPPAGSGPAPGAPAAAPSASNLLIDFVRVVRWRQPTLNLTLKKISPDPDQDPRDKRFWTIQVNVLAPGRGWRTEFPKLDQPIRGTDYVLADADIRDVQNAKTGRAEREYSMTVRSASDPKQEYTVRIDERIPAGNPEFLLVYLREKRQIIAAQGTPFALAGEGGQTQHFKIVEGTAEWAKVLQTDAQGKALSDKLYQIGTLTDDDRRSFLGAPGGEGGEAPPPPPEAAPQPR